MVENEQSQIETEDNQEFAFVIVSIRKFWILYILSFGFSQIVYEYLNWKKQREIRKEKISPAWRTALNVIWMFSLVNRIKNQSKHEKVKKWNAVGSATLVLFLIILNLYSDIMYQSAFLDEPLASLCLSLIYFFINGIIFAGWQGRINLSSDDVKGLTNNKITFRNFLLLLVPWGIFGLLIYLASINTV